jgi:N-dimethylarginine dimethylaminohydrolase
MTTFLMCPPEYFTVAYEINPFMHTEVRVDPERARVEWDALKRTLEECGAKVEIQHPEPGCPDLVFTANAALVKGDVAVPARFLHPERRGEEPYDHAWLAAHDYEVRELPEGAYFEGAGDAMPVGPDAAIFAGYRWRTSITSHAELARVLGRPVRSIALVDARFYHLDLALLPLGEQRAIAVGPAFDRYDATIVAAAVPDVWEVGVEEGLAFVANAVVVDDKVVMHTCPPSVGRTLEAWGFAPVECPVGEFLKAGGSCRCLTLKVRD